MEFDVWLLGKPRYTAFTEYVQYWILYWRSSKMHEFSVANQAVDRILELAINKGAKRVDRVEILLGELCMFSGDQLVFWIKEILNSRGNIADNIEIDLKQIQAIIKCRQCGYEGNLKKEGEENLSRPLERDKYPLFLCPSCSQGDIDIIKGRECVLGRVQLEI